MRKVTSVYLEESIIRQLQEMDVNVSDMANLLFTMWIKHLKEENMMRKVVSDTTAAYIMEQIKKKVYG